MPIMAHMLHEIPLFALLDEDELAELASHIDEMSYKANQHIFKAGDPGVNMQIVLTGKVETYITDDEGQRVSFGIIEKGEMFGELSLLDSEPRSANAVALEDTTTFIIDRDDLLRLFSRKPMAALDIMSILGRRIRNTDAMLRTRVARNVNEIVDEKYTFGQKVADGVARFGGSWNFIGLFAAILITWVILNTVILRDHAYDPYPFILLNLFLSMLAALQAPVIMMSQNRQAAKDRIQADLDYQTNLKAELEIMQLHRKVDEMQADLEARLEGRHVPPVQTLSNGGAK
jgi:uncharacterized membrane protein